MIGNKSTGRGFQGAVSCALKDQAEQLACGTLDGATPRELAREVGWLREWRADLKAPVLHRTLSLAAGKQLDPDIWENVRTEKYMERMAFEDAPWKTSRHVDADFDHVHIVALPIDPSDSTASPGLLAFRILHNYRRSAEIIQDLESRYGLQSGALTPGQALQKTQRQRSSTAVQRAVRTANTLDKAKLQEAVRAALEGSRSFEEFEARLGVVGVKIRAYSKAGRLSGLSYALDGYVAKGSQLGKAFTAAVVMET